MNMKFSKILFLSILLASTIISISASSWFGAWLGMEMNLLSFIPLIFNTTNQRYSESAMKYFVIQAVASATMIMSAMTMMMKTPQTTSMISMTIMMALLMKAGAAPVHFWFPSVMEGMTWINCIILMTWQKIAPLMLMSYTYVTTMIVMAAMASGAVGAAGGMNQTLLRKLMAYSSIGHMGWLLAAMTISEEFWMTYMLIYAMLSSLVAMHMNKSMMFHLSQSFITSKNKTMNFMMSTNLLSLGGLPPFLGFLPKWMIMQILMKTSPTTTLVLIASALVNLFYYLRISMTPMIMSLEEEKWSKSQNLQTPSIVMMSMTSISMSGMLAMPLIWPKM